MTRRAWCARVRFPGKRSFLFGTVFASREESEARPMMLAHLAEAFPDLPEIVAMIPGTVVFVAEGEG